MTNQLPDVAALVKEFDLRKKGRDNGSIDKPPATQSGLDPVENDVEDRCHRSLKKRTESYRRERDALQSRMKPEGPEEDADTMAEESCKAMENMILTAKANLEEYRGNVEKYQSTLQIIREKYDLDGSEMPKVPESSFKFFGILSFLILIETMINGIFFGANLRGGLLGGMTYAVMISLVNVVALGWVTGRLVAWLFGPTSQMSDPQRLSGILGLLVAIAVGVLLNLGVAHYREALPVDYPPAPESVDNSSTLAAPTPTSEASVVSRCWQGNDEIVAGREAICLFWSQWFVLNDFQSYVLMLIGLAMFGGAAWKWRGRQDLYPGFGQATQKFQHAKQALGVYEGDLLEELEHRRKEAVQRQEKHARLADPVAHYYQARRAYDELCKNHEDLREDAAHLKESCRKAIACYRSENRDARREPEPVSWRTEWAANWELPDPPVKPDIASRSDAQRRAAEAKSAKDARIKKVNDCYEKSAAEVRKIARIQVV